MGPQRRAGGGGGLAERVRTFLVRIKFINGLQRKCLGRFILRWKNRWRTSEKKSLNISGKCFVKFLYFWFLCSVTTFGEKLATFTKHFTTKILMVYLVFDKILNLLWQKFYAIGQIFIVVNCKILNSYLVIWSLCSFGPSILFELM